MDGGGAFGGGAPVGLGHLIDTIQIASGTVGARKPTVLFFFRVVVNVSHGPFYFCIPVRFACITIVCSAYAVPENMTRSSLC
jgi:hypothetical protein